MALGIYWLEILIGAVILGLVGTVGYLLYDIGEHKLELDKRHKKEDYEEALDNLEKHPKDHKAQEEAYKKGDVYFKMKIPDYFEYPLPDFDTHFEYIDNRKIRKELIAKDIDHKIHHRKAA